MVVLLMIPDMVLLVRLVQTKTTRKSYQPHVYIFCVMLKTLSVSSIVFTLITRKYFIINISWNQCFVDFLGMPFLDMASSRFVIFSFYKSTFCMLIPIITELAPNA